MPKYQVKQPSQIDIKRFEQNLGTKRHLLSHAEKKFDSGNVIPFNDKAGTVYTGSLEKSLGRICAFNESGLGSAIGYNDLALST